jgi:dihydroorotase
VLAFLYVNGPGISEHPKNEGRTDVAGLTPELSAAMAKRFPDIIVGIKVKAGRNQAADPPDAPAWAQVDAAIEAGRLAGIPVMVDFIPWPPYETYEKLITEKLRPGDMHTHGFHGMYPIVLPDGSINPATTAAQRRGVILDVGHGMGSFVFRNSAPATAAGVWPNTISTDLHRGTVNGPAVDMLTVMSKFLIMGMPLDEVIKRATMAPADAIRRPELGSLSEGAEADIAVIEERHGRFSYTDIRRAKLTGDRKLEGRLTLRAGEIVYDPQGFSMPEWKDAPKEYWEGLITKQTW